MSGHSKWATTKHKKAAVDAKRGKLFTKLIREITVAAKAGGGSVEANPRLRFAMQKAREANMPSDTMERAVKKGTGELEGVSFEEVIYEGYGPGGVAILVEAVTDNKNRTSSELRSLFSKRGGNLAGAGSVGWIFKKKGYFLVDKQGANEEKLMTLALENGAEDMRNEGSTFEITCEAKEFERLKEVLQQSPFKVQTAELTSLPSSHVKVDGEPARQLLQLIESLEDHDDVQNVYANFDIPEEILQS